MNSLVRIQRCHLAQVGGQDWEDNPEVVVQDGILDHCSVFM